MKKLLLILAVIAVSINCFGKRENADPTASSPVIGELKIEDIKKGTGLEIAKDQKIVMHYKGTLENGTEFANSYKQGEPLLVLFGNRQLIKGMEEGMIGMKIGGVRKLVIPPHLAYGTRGLRKPNTSSSMRGSVVNEGYLVPPNSTLVFEVKLVDILK